MSGDLQKRKLLVISDSPVYKEAGRYIAFEPVVRELEALSEMFDEIIWLGSRVKNRKHAMRAPANDKIEIVGMPSVNNAFLNFAFILLNYPVFLYHILRHLRAATHVHTRGPSHPALLGMIISRFDKSHRYWHKYAGNWVAPKLPATYNLQRSLLRQSYANNVRVTVNGKWQNDPMHVVPFENPCLYEAERLQAVEKQAAKSFSGDLKLLFVGNLNEAKGILELMDAIASPGFPGRIKDIYIIGDGNLIDVVKAKATDINHVNIHIEGFLNRKEINAHYEACHLIILPSRSEGFPKVIAEAASYGCIPVVTNVSSISQYIIDRENGYLLADNTPITILNALKEAAADTELGSMSRRVSGITHLFTYERFLENIKNKVFA